MSDDAEEIARSIAVGETIASLLATDEGRAFLVELAARIRPSIMNIPFSELVRERLKGDSLAAIVDIAASHGAAPVDTLPFGDVMRQLPEDARELVADHIIAAGWS